MGDMGKGRFDGRLCAACALTLCWPAPVQAHSLVGTLGVFWAGVVHPLISLDQLGPLLALAIWVVWRARRADALVAFLPVGAFLGAWAAPSGGAFPFLAPAAMVLFGAMAAVRADLASAWIERLAVAAGGLSIGIASAVGAEGFPRILYAIGVALAVASVAAYALLAARHAAEIPRWIETLARSGAAIIATVGIGLFAASFVGWRAP